MTVYVDNAAVPFRGKPRYHLTADSLPELHTFCLQVGIKRCWYHASSRYPHYDVTAAERERALEAGARAVDVRELVARARRLKPAKQAAALERSGAAAELLVAVPEPTSAAGRN